MFATTSAAHTALRPSEKQKTRTGRTVERSPQFTALCQAFAADDWDKVKPMLAAHGGAFFLHSRYQGNGTRSVRGYTLIHHLLQTHPQGARVLRGLLKLDVESKMIEQVSDMGDYPVHMAAKLGSRAALDELVPLSGANKQADRIDHNHRCKHSTGKKANGYTPVQAAIRSGQLETAEYLLRHHQANVEAPDGYGGGALHHAAEKNKPKAIDLLVRLHANVNARDQEGQTPLHYAARYGCADAITQLRKHGANVNARDVHGLTPLNYAKGKPGVIQALGPNAVQGQILPAPAFDFKNPLANALRERTTPTPQEFVQTPIAHVQTEWAFEEVDFWHSIAAAPTTIDASANSNTEKAASPQPQVESYFDALHDYFYEQDGYGYWWGSGCDNQHNDSAPVFCEIASDAPAGNTTTVTQPATSPTPQVPDYFGHPNSFGFPNSPSPRLRQSPDFSENPKAPKRARLNEQTQRQRSTTKSPSPYLGCWG